MSGNGGERQYRLDLSFRQATRADAVGKSIDYLGSSVCHERTSLSRLLYVTLRH
jgi:hypothetical protein